MVSAPSFASLILMWAPDRKRPPTYNGGMNISLGDFAKNDYAFVAICIFSFMLALFVAYLLKKKDML